MASLWWC